LSQNVELTSEWTNVAAPWLDLWRRVYIDLPLIGAMESSHFAGQVVNSQLEHWSKVATCTSVADLAAQEVRFAGASISELQEEVAVLAQETKLALTA
jgi:hypothetical protein